ncbi:OLC1v1033153C1 [Oldenlandia corymbosa var. corymbosa]|uniref:OLC1v1033153C1 n=1 Tax=Oldenlandia corymbosa var. corymbosa TaxID=529605 RepID=A0AAV1CND2_OLDCO|nr:OLC1v1033153C1 [Oldenlandia corymbosa var. corymbosa]
MLSPGKLRSMILGSGGGGGGSDKKGAQGTGGEDDYLDEELESTSLSMRSQGLEIQDFGDDGYDNCKDVDVVSVLPGFPTVATPEISAHSEISYDSGLKDNSLVSSRVRSTDESSMHYDSGNDATSVSSSAFEFQKSERAQQRVPLAPFSKPAPSKWDDAQKWIASPTANLPKNGQPTQGIGSRKGSYFGYGSRQSSTKVVVEVTDQKMIPYDEPDTKQIDSSLARKQSGMQKVVDWDAYQCTSESYSKPVVMMDNFIGESAMAFSRHDSSLAVHSATAIIPPPSTARSVSMRDMGTEMTPIASQEPSRTGTPVRATTPTRSPSTSMPSSPGRAAPVMPPGDPSNEHLDDDIKESSEKELQMKTRREIMLLGTQLGKMNIAAWASKDNENKEALASIKTVATEQPSQSVIETRAVAWEEAEKAKYMARFKREEIRIQAWENHQKAKTEAEMRKTEVEVERMRAKAQDKLMNKLASVQHKAEERHAQAEAKRNRRAAKAEKQAEYIRTTGRIPSSFRCWNWCHWCS